MKPERTILMGTYEPEKLLSLWTSEQIDVEMAMGYDLQNAVKLHNAQTAISVTLRQLQARIHTLETNVQTHQTAIKRFQTLIDGLLTQTGMKSKKVEKEPPKKR